MFSKSNIVLLSLLAMTAIACSRTMLVSIDDPEGPNLLVVFGMAGVIAFVSWAVYLYASSAGDFSRRLFRVPLLNFKQSSILVLIQGFVTIGLYFLLS